MRILRSAAALAAALALSGAAYQRAPTTPQATAPAERAGTKAAARAEPEAVLAKLHAIDRMQQAAVRLARQKSRDSEVIRFARLVGRDHRLIDRKLSRLAAREHWGVAVAPADSREAAAMRKLEAAAAGPEFDRAFVEAMKADHDRALSSLGAARAAATDTRLRGFLDQVLPVLRQHRQLADKLLHKRLV